MDGKRILHGMIEIYENDFMCGYLGEDKKELQVIFLELIMYVTRYVNDYRYCSKGDCLAVQNIIFKKWLVSMKMKYLKNY